MTASRRQQTLMVVAVEPALVWKVVFGRREGGLRSAGTSDIQSAFCVEPLARGKRTVGNRKQVC